MEEHEEMERIGRNKVTIGNQLMRKKRQMNGATSNLDLLKLKGSGERTWLLPHSIRTKKLGKNENECQVNVK
jgi:hypothetical protein